MSKTRYESELEILTAIDRAHRRLQRYRERAASLESGIKLMIQQADSMALIHEGRRKADYCLRMVSSIENGVLVVLKEKLSVMRTPQLPAVDNGDRSIPKLKRKRARQDLSPPPTVLFADKFRP